MFNNNLKEKVWLLQDSRAFRSEVKDLELKLKLLMEYFGVEFKFDYQEEKLGRTSSGQWEVVKKNEKKTKKA